MVRAGRAHWITIAGIAGAVALAIVLYFGGDSPTSVANRFLVALAKGDVETLVELSYYEGDESLLRKQWEYATRVAAPYYRFTWDIVTVKQPTEDSAAVRTSFERSYGPGSFPERFDIPLRRVNGKWMVDVRLLSRGLYPALPR